MNNSSCSITMNTLSTANTTVLTSPVAMDVSMIGDHPHYMMQFAVQQPAAVSAGKASPPSPPSPFSAHRAGTFDLPAASSPKKARKRNAVGLILSRKRAEEEAELLQQQQLHLRQNECSTNSNANSNANASDSNDSVSSSNNKRSRKDDAVVVDVPARPLDIICGRGKPCQQHPGNIRFLSIVDKYKDAYADAPRCDKLAIAAAVVKEALDGDRVRFLRRLSQKGPTEDVWAQVSDEAALDKASHALRAKGRRTKYSAADIDAATAMSVVREDDASDLAVAAMQISSPGGSGANDSSSSNNSINSNNNNNNNNSHLRARMLAERERADRANLAHKSSTSPSLRSENSNLNNSNNNSTNTILRPDAMRLSQAAAASQMTPHQPSPSSMSYSSVPMTPETIHAVRRRNPLIVTPEHPNHQQMRQARFYSDQDYTSTGLPSFAAHRHSNNRNDNMMQNIGVDCNSMAYQQQQLLKQQQQFMQNGSFHGSPHEQRMHASPSSSSSWNNGNGSMGFSRVSPSSMTPAEMVAYRRKLQLLILQQNLPFSNNR